jgi:protein O-mannosyl-transferase
MSGKLSRKERAKLQSEQHKAAQASEEIVSNVPKKKTQPAPRPRLTDYDFVKRLNLILIILAAGVYINTLGHQYALDDYGLILENQDTKGGTANIGKILSSSYRSGMLGGDVTLYRPLSKVMFAIEWSMSPNNPFPGHFMNVVLFTLSVVLLFKMLRRYMNGQLAVPFLASALFAVHPIHTEVVANIKGRDDILCFLFFVIAALYIHRYVFSKQTKHLPFAGVSYFLCMLSKESAITFVAIFPLMIYFFTQADRTTSLRVAGVTGGVVVLFLLIRLMVLGVHSSSPVPVVDNYLAGIDGFVGQRVAAIAIAGIYAIKLFVPYELVCDASIAQMPEYGMGSWQFLVALAIYGGGIAFAIMKFRSKHIVSFAVLYFLITFSIVSNIPFLLGTNYGERLLYTPSLGVCIILAWVIHRIFFTEETKADSLDSFFRLNMKPVAVVGIIAVIYSGITVMRNPVWYDNETLYGTDVQISERSCKLHYFYANHLTQEENLSLHKAGSPEWNKIIDTAMAEFRIAISLYPTYGDALQKLAEMFYNKKQLDSSEYYYKLAIKSNPGMASYRSNYGRLLFDQQRLTEAEYQFQHAVHLNAQYPEAYNNLAAVYGTWGMKYRNLAATRPDSAQAYTDKANQLFNKSLQNSLAAIASNPNFSSAYETTAMTYGILGDGQKQQEYAQAAQRLRAAGIEK